MKKSCKLLLEAALLVTLVFVVDVSLKITSTRAESHGIQNTTEAGFGCRTEVTTMMMLL